MLLSYCSRSFNSVTSGSLIWIQVCEEVTQQTAEAPADLWQSWSIFSSNPRLQIWHHPRLPPILCSAAALASWRGRAAPGAPPTWATPTPTGRSSRTRRPMMGQTKKRRRPDCSAFDLQQISSPSRLWVSEKGEHYKDILAQRWSSCEVNKKISCFLNCIFCYDKHFLMHSFHKWVTRK